MHSHFRRQCSEDYQNNHINTDQTKERYNPTSSQEIRTSVTQSQANQTGDNNTSVRPSDNSMNMNQTTNVYDGSREREKHGKRRKKKPERPPGCMTK
ncbi:hypothetical protein CHS0354_014116 [Potamilus streckersoni]|uniref:Uncharacterized protein n=1 Tax=Potamilus streckersoni TaxID=2493646 RepID=A0AAE0TJX5_9BIVA|nr:hypothetical protein CHS0354_014116 [Potamilus streckersoni]